MWTGQSSSTPVAHYNGATADEMMLALWGILTFCFFVQTLRINRGLQTLFISLTILFFLLAGGVKNALCNKVPLSPARPAPASLLCLSACGLLCTSWLSCKPVLLAFWDAILLLLAAHLCKAALLVSCCPLYTASSCFGPRVVDNQIRWSQEAGGAHWQDDGMRKGADSEPCAWATSMRN